MARSNLIHCLSSEQSNFTDNTPSSFFTLLNHPINTPVGSKIGVLEISYNNKLFVDDENASIEIFSWDVKLPGDVWGRKTTVQLHRESFANIDSLVGSINNYIFDASPTIKQKRSKLFQFDEHLNRLWFIIESDDLITIRLRGKILNLLGVTNKPLSKKFYIIVGKSKEGTGYSWDGEFRKFDKNFLEDLKSVSQKTNIFQFPPKIHDDFSTVVLYSNIVESSYIGHGRAPILRLFPFQASQNDEMVTISFASSPQYLNLVSNQIQLIALELRSLNGNLLPLSGYCRVTLELILPP